MRNSYMSTFFMIFLWAGLTVADRSWNGAVYVYTGEYRAPAAVRTLSDYSILDRQALSRTPPVQLLHDARLFKDDFSIGLQLGHPLLNRAGGLRAFGCEVRDHSGAYDRIELRFVGQGVGEAGEPARMSVTAPCHAKENLNRLDTIWVPLAEVYRRPATDQEFEVGGPSPVSVRLEDVPAVWPESWVLMSIRLFREDDQEPPLILDTDELRQARPQLIEIDWKKSL